MPDAAVIRDDAPGWTRRQPARMIYQLPTELSPADLMQLQKLGNKDAEDLALGLLKQAYQAYRVGSLLVLVSVEGQDLVMNAVVQKGEKGAYFASLTAGLERLAREWGCKRIVTHTDDPQVQRLLQRFGGKITSVTLVKEV